MLKKITVLFALLITSSVTYASSEKSNRSNNLEFSLQLISEDIFRKKITDYNKPLIENSEYGEYSHRDVLFGSKGLQIKNPGNFQFIKLMADLQKGGKSDAAHIFEKLSKKGSHFLTFDDDLEIWIPLLQEEAEEMVSFYFTILHGYFYALIH